MSRSYFVPGVTPRNHLVHSASMSPQRSVHQQQQNQQRYYFDNNSHTEGISSIMAPNDAQTIDPIIAAARLLPPDIVEATGRIKYLSQRVDGLEAENLALKERLRSLHDSMESDRGKELRMEVLDLQRQEIERSHAEIAAQKDMITALELQSEPRLLTQISTMDKELKLLREQMRKQEQQNETYVRMQSDLAEMTRKYERLMNATSQSYANSSTLDGGSKVAEGLREVVQSIKSHIPEGNEESLRKECYTLRSEVAEYRHKTVMLETQLKKLKVEVSRKSESTAWIEVDRLKKELEHLRSVLCTTTSTPGGDSIMKRILNDNQELLVRCQELEGELKRVKNTSTVVVQPPTSVRLLPSSDTWSFS
eukprot:PhF_6_TR13514/c0_g1_i3/m.21595